MVNMGLTPLLPTARSSFVSAAGASRTQRGVAILRAVFRGEREQPVGVTSRSRPFRPLGDPKSIRPFEDIIDDPGSGADVVSAGAP